MNTKIIRLIAGVIDISVLSVAAASFFAFIFSLSAFLSYFTGVRFNQIKVMNSFTMIAIITMYETICLYFFKGKTLGKMIFNLQVKSANKAGANDGKFEITKDNDYDLDIYTCLLRSLIKGVVISGFAGVLLILNMLLIVLGQTSMMVYDRIAKTTVEIEGGI